MPITAKPRLADKQTTTTASKPTTTKRYPKPRIADKPTVTSNSGGSRLTTSTATTTDTAAPVAPAAPPAAPATGVPASGVTPPGADLTAEMLDAALRAIEAEYGLTQAELLSDESDIGRQYRLLLVEAQRLGARQQEALQAGALDRGILRSGIYADQVSEVAQAQAEQQAALEADRQRKLAEIAAQKAALPAQQAAAEAAAAQQAAQAGLDLDLIKAAARGGLG